jgi:hypothetical protein
MLEIFFPSYLLPLMPGKEMLNHLVSKPTTMVARVKKKCDKTCFITDIRKLLVVVSKIL